MDAYHAIRDRARLKISAWWHTLPQEERVLNVLTTLLFVPTMLLFGLESGFVQADPPLASWLKYGPVLLRLGDIDIILLVAFFTCLIASMLLIVRRKQPDIWSRFQQLWSIRAILVGFGIVCAVVVWTSVLDLATPIDQLPGNPPSPLVLPTLAAGFLFTGGGMLLLFPELFVRTMRAGPR